MARGGDNLHKWQKPAGEVARAAAGVSGPGSNIFRRRRRPKVPRVPPPRDDRRLSLSRPSHAITSQALAFPLYTISAGLISGRIAMCPCRASVLVAPFADRLPNAWQRPSLRLGPTPPSSSVILRQPRASRPRVRPPPPANFPPSRLRTRCPFPFPTGLILGFSLLCSTARPLIAGSCAEESASKARTPAR
jgi:hypothetical protein